MPVEAGRSTSRAYRRAVWDGRGHYGACSGMCELGIGIAVLITLATAWPQGPDDVTPAESPEVTRAVLARAIESADTLLASPEFSGEKPIRRNDRTGRMAELNRSLVAAGQRDDARRRLLQDCEHLHRDFQTTLAHAAHGIEAFGFFWLMESLDPIVRAVRTNSRLLHEAGFDDEARQVLADVREALSTTTEDIADVFGELLFAQANIGDATGARTTLDQFLQYIERFHRANPPDPGKLEPKDPYQCDFFLVNGQILNGEYDAAFQGLSRNIERALQVAAQPVPWGEGPPQTEEDIWLHATVNALYIGEMLGTGFAADRSAPQVDRLWALLEKTPGPIFQDVREQFPTWYASCGADDRAVELLRQFAAEFDRDPAGNVARAGRPTRWERYDEAVRKEENWSSRVKGWSALAVARQKRHQDEPEKQALRELESLLRNPPPRTRSKPEADAANLPAGDPRDDALGPVAVPVTGSALFDDQDRVTLVPELMVEWARLGEPDRALELTDLLPLEERWECDTVLADASEAAGLLDKAQALRRRALNAALETRERLSSPGSRLETCLPPDHVWNPYPSLSLEPLMPLRPADHDERFARRLWLDERDHPSEAHQRVLAVLGRRIAQLQAWLGRFEEAWTMAESVPAKAVPPYHRPYATARSEALADVGYWMCRRGSSGPAFERAARIADAPDRLDALIAVARGCGDRLADLAK